MSEQSTNGPTTSNAPSITSSVKEKIHVESLREKD